LKWPLVVAAFGFPVFALFVVWRTM